MNTFLRLTVLHLFFCLLRGCTCTYTEEELGLVRSMGLSMGVRSFVFVQNSEYVDLLQNLKNFIEYNSYSTVMSTRQLVQILSDCIKRVAFFENRVIFVTKEKLNFTYMLQKLSGIRSVTWIVFADSMAGIEDSYVPMNTKFFIVQNLPTNIIVKKAYNLKPDLNISLENTAILSKTEVTEPFVIKKHKVDFHNAVLRMLYLSSEEACNSGSVKYVLSRMECFHQEIIRILADRLNFNITTVGCPEKQYPYNYPNGSLSEFFQVLARNEADISSGSYIVSGERMNLFDFVWPVFITKSMLFIKFKSQDIHWLAYVRPVEGHVWRAIACWIVITGTIIHISDNFRTGNFTLRLSLIPGLIKSIFVSLQVFCNQGVHGISSWFSDRAVFILTFLLFISLYQAYCACLISSMTVVIPNFPFTSLTEFFEEGTYKIITVQAGFHNFFVKTTLRDMHMENRDLMIDDNSLPVDIFSAIIELCRNTKLVYVEFRENLVQYEIPCKLTELPKSMLIRHIGIGFPKNSPYTDIVRQELSVLRTTGIMHRMRKYLMSYVNLEEKQVDEDEEINVEMGHVFSIFLILGGGAVLSIVILFLELLNHQSVKLSNRWRWKRSQKGAQQPVRKHFRRLATLQQKLFSQ